jgi:hypothetical protein
MSCQGFGAITKDDVEQRALNYTCPHVLCLQGAPAPTEQQPEEGACAGLCQVLRW